MIELKGFTINIPNYEYSGWREIYNNYKYSITDILNNILADLSCDIEYSYGRPMMTTVARYKILLEQYYYFLVKLTNPIEYNVYLDKLITKHNNNLLFEELNPYVNPNDKKSKSKNKSNIVKNKIKNEYVRQETKDLFTGVTKYFYVNYKTGDSIESYDGDLLLTLNSKKKKKTKSKVVAVSLDAMTFSFKKKS